MNNETKTRKLIEAGNAAYIAAISILKNRAEAQDIAQDVIEYLLKYNEDDIRNPSSVGWIAGRNRSLNLIKKKAISSKVITPRYLGFEITVHLESSTIELMDSIENNEQLTDEEKTFMLMTLIEIPMSEIGEHLGVSRTKLYNIRRSIARKISKENLMKGEVR